MIDLEHCSKMIDNLFDITLRNLTYDFSPSEVPPEYVLTPYVVCSGQSKRFSYLYHELLW